MNTNNKITLSQTVQTFHVRDNQSYVLAANNDSSNQGTLCFYVYEQARLLLHALWYDVEAVDCTIHIYLVGRYAQAEVKGLYFLNHQEKVTITTLQHHQAPDTRSDLVIKGIVDQKAQALYDGMIRIDKQADKSWGNQQNKNIVLSSQAQVKSVPNIEVLTNDVQCFHGSAIGQFQKDQWFYLQTRGLDAKTSKKILLRAFFSDVLQSYQEKENVYATLEGKL